MNVTRLFLDPFDDDQVDQLYNRSLVLVVANVVVGACVSLDLAFGIVRHFCAGPLVARLEMEMAFTSLIPRIDEIELAGPPERLFSALVGGVKHLPIRYSLRPA